MVDQIKGVRRGGIGERVGGSATRMSASPKMAMVSARHSRPCRELFGFLRVRVLADPAWLLLGQGLRASVSWSREVTSSLGKAR